MNAAGPTGVVGKLGLMGGARQEDQATLKIHPDDQRIQEDSIYRPAPVT